MKGQRPSKGQEGEQKALVTIKNSYKGEERKQPPGSRGMSHSKGPRKERKSKARALNKYLAEGPGG